MWDRQHRALLPRGRAVLGRLRGHPGAHLLADREREPGRGHPPRPVRGLLHGLAPLLLGRQDRRQHPAVRRPGHRQGGRPQHGRVDRVGLHGRLVHGQRRHHLDELGERRPQGVGHVLDAHHRRGRPAGQHQLRRYLRPGGQPPGAGRQGQAELPRGEGNLVAGLGGHPGHQLLPQRHLLLGGATGRGGLSERFLLG